MRPATLMVRAVVAALVVAVGGPCRGRWGPVSRRDECCQRRHVGSGQVIQNTYWTGTACRPGGGGGRNGETGETAAEVIVTRVPVVR